jgi:hypothetical protein
MAEGAATSEEQKAAQPPGQRNPAAPPSEVSSVWPVVILPAAVIAVAAVAGYLAGIVGYQSDELVTLAVGTVTAAVLVGFVAYRILGRRRSWQIALVLGVVAVLLFGLGMAKLREASPPAASSPQVSTAPAAASSHNNAGRQFTQQVIGEVRDFRGADLRGAHLAHLDLRGIDFSGADAAGASFEGSRLDRAIFRGADLGGAVLDNACLHLAVLHGADLTGARAAGADVAGAEVSRDETAVAAQWPAPNAASTACS